MARLAPVSSGNAVSALYKLGDGEVRRVCAHAATTAAHQLALHKPLPQLLHRDGWGRERGRGDDREGRRRGRPGPGRAAGGRPRQRGHHKSHFASYGFKQRTTYS